MTDRPSPSPRKPPSSKRPGQAQIVAELGTMILRGDYPVGTNLPNEAELTERFSVSRTVIREVMKTLAAKGLVVAKTKIGTRVADRMIWNMFDVDVLAWRVEAGMDRSFLKSLFEVRLAVEPASAALAAIHRTADDIEIMRGHVEEMAASGHTKASFADADLKLHLAIANASGNPFMRSIGAIIEAALGAAFALSSPVEDLARHRRSAREHGAIVDAIEARDPGKASEAMLKVIEEGMRNRSGALEDAVSV